MPVQPKPKDNLSDTNRNQIEKFVDGALPHSPEKSEKVTISLRFNKNLLASIDDMAVRRGMSRNAIISYWCSRGVENE